MPRSDYGRGPKASSFVLLIVLLLSALCNYAQVKLKPLSEADLVDLLRHYVTPVRIAELAREEGIDFNMTPESEKELRRAGADTVLIGELEKLSPKISPTDQTADVSSELKLAKDFFNSKSYGAALAWFRTSSSAGSPEAQRYLGILYENGWGVEKDYRQAFQYYDKAATAGDATAEYRLGLLYLKGWGTTEDRTLARVLFDRAARAGDVNAMEIVAHFYDVVDHDYSHAREWYEKAALAGGNLAAYNLGVMYEIDPGAGQNYTRAFYWYRKAAEKNDFSAYAVGRFYQDGKGVSRDYSEARRYYESAAAAGDTSAMKRLGDLYAFGLGVAEDYTLARQWYEKAAAGTKTSRAADDAMNALGHLYERGLGVDMDLIQAREWYEKAATANNTAAMNSLGEMYEHGLGVRQDYAEARRWYEKAADAGEASAMRNLANLYEQGIGITQDRAQARQWYDKAAGLVEASGLGMTVATLTPFVSERLNLPKETRGVVVEQVEQGSPANQHGIARGDVIVAIDSRLVTSTVDFKRLISLVDRGSVMLTLNGRAGNLLVVLESR